MQNETLRAPSDAVMNKKSGDSAGILFVVGTPIGNLEDLSPRAARVLREASLVAAEDTRVTRRLLNHIGARPKLVSFHEHNWRDRLESVLHALEDGNAALVSDAGMPGVSDPGRELVAAAAARGFRVESVPGPSAVTTALAVSGMAADAFQFLGFLPRRRKERQERLREAVGSPLTMVLFEAPHRVSATLEDISLVVGERPIAVCRELTKLHEEVFRGTAAAALEHFGAPRGEFALVIAGAAPVSAPEDDVGAVRLFLVESRAAGTRAKDAVDEAVVRFGISKNRAYDLWLETRGDYGSKTGNRGNASAARTEA